MNHNVTSLIICLRNALPETYHLLHLSDLLRYQMMASLSTYQGSLHVRQDLFGTPYITFDNNTLTNKFYILNKAILRTVVDKGNVVAFFITSTSSQIDIPVDSFENDTREIGNTTYDSIDFANPQIESNASANGRYNYYGEIQETGRYGMWNYYLFGTLPYGFDDDSAINLLMLTAFDDSPNQNQVEILRKTAKPNTFAIIASDYYDHISLLPISDEWENIYHLLIRAQSD